MKRTPLIQWKETEASSFEKKAELNTIPVFEEKFLRRYDVRDDMSQSSVWDRGTLCARNLQARAFLVDATETRALSQPPANS